MNRSRPIPPVCAFLLAVGAAAPALAAPSGAPISVENAWSRPALPGLPNGVIYLTVTNRGRADDRLVGASSPVAAHVGLHRSVVSGGVSGMAPVRDGLQIPAGGRAALQPNGYHLMMTGLKGGLAAGTRFPATLVFAHAGRVSISVQVRATPPG